MKTSLDVVVSDKYLRKYVNHFAYKISKTFPNSMDKEDAEGDIWESIIVAIKKRENDEDLMKVARSTVFSKCGPAIHQPSEKIKFNEEMHRIENGFEHTPNYIDKSHAVIEARWLIDQVESILVYRSTEWKQYKMALRWFRLMKKGYSTVESARELSVTTSYLYRLRTRVFDTIRQEFSIAYNR